MWNPLAALKTHLTKDAEKGSRSAILFAQIVLFTATCFIRKTRLYAEHDRTGFLTALSYQIIAILVSNSRTLSDLRNRNDRSDLRNRSDRSQHDRSFCAKLNLIANLICFILAIVLDVKNEEIFGKSLSSLGFALSITVLFLILLVIIRPSTDFGLFSFLIGVIGSVASNLFGLKFQTLIVIVICFLLWGFRYWLEENRLELGGNESLPIIHNTRRRNQICNQICKSSIIEGLTVTCFHFFWIYNLFRINCRKIEGSPESISCTYSSYMIEGMLVCLLIFSFWFGIAVIFRAYCLSVGVYEQGMGADIVIGAGAGSVVVGPDARSVSIGTGVRRVGVAPGARIVSVGRGAGTVTLGSDVSTVKVGPRTDVILDPEVGTITVDPRAGAFDIVPSADPFHVRLRRRVGAEEGVR